MQLRRLTRTVRTRPATTAVLRGGTFPTDPDARRKWENRWQKRLMGE